MDVLLLLIAKLFWFIFRTVPLVLCKLMPQAHGNVSLLNLYIFLQAFALAMFLFVSIFSAMSVRISTAFVNDAGLVFYHPVKLATYCVVYFSVMWALFFLGWSLWTVTWETYYDFPTVRRMILGPRHPSSLAIGPVPGGSSSTSVEAVSENVLENSGSTTSMSSPTASTPAVTRRGSLTSVEDDVDATPQMQESSGSTTSMTSPTASITSATPVATRRGSLTSIDEDNGEATPHSRAVPSSTSSATVRSILRSRSSSRSSTAQSRTSSSTDSDLNTRSKSRLRLRFSDAPVGDETEGVAVDCTKRRPNFLKSRSGMLAGPGSERRESRRRIVLLTPMVVLTCFHTFLVVGTRICQYRSDRCAGGTGVLHSSSRMNKIAQHSLFVIEFQMLVAWTSFFPSWEAAFLATRCRNCWLTNFLSMTLQFIVFPSILGQAAFWFSGYNTCLPVLTGWSSWFLLSSLVILRPENAYRAGFAFSNVTDDDAWQSFCMLFKVTAVLWGFIHLAREVSTNGMSSAQKDTIIVGCVYPLLWCIIWAVSYLIVSARRFAWKFHVTLCIMGVFCVRLSFSLCAIIDRSDLPLLLTLVWISLFYGSFRSLCRLGVGIEQKLGSPGKPTLKRGPTVKFALSPVGAKRERAMASQTVRILWCAIFLFCTVLAACVVAAGLQQQRHGPDAKDEVYWKSNSSGTKVVFADSSILLLGRAATNNTERQSEIRHSSTQEQFCVSSSPGQLDYAACGYKWKGLDLKDFAFFSLAAYVAPLESNGLEQLLQELLPRKTVRIRTAKSFPRKWLEIEVKTCPQKANFVGSSECQVVTVVAVSGTDPSKVQDILENIRMWTEPVIMEIFSVIFPIVRAWRRETTASVIGGIHKILRWLAIQDDRWHYVEILNHVCHLPADREVVIVGHSLGGGIALVVGALSGRHAVAIQPPGLYHALAKHQEQHSSTMGVGRELHQNSVSLLVESDPISLFDRHGGLVQTIACEAGNAIGCHALEETLCHLIKNCRAAHVDFNECQYIARPTTPNVTRGDF